MIPQDVEDAIIKSWRGMGDDRPVPPLADRINEAIRRVTHGIGGMRIPADLTDADLVLGDCRKAIELLTTRAESAERERDRAVSVLVGTLEMDHDAQIIVSWGHYVSPTDSGTFEVYGRGPRVEYATAREAVEAALKEAR